MMHFGLLWLVKVLAAGEAMTDNGTFGPKIIGGIDAADGMFPWMVALFHRELYICSASLISERLVLTAAHCIALIQENDRTSRPEDFTGHAGSVDKYSAAPKIEFESLNLFPGYRGPSSDPNDVAVLVTKEPVAFTSTVHRVCLSSESGDRRRTYRKALAMGWGRTTRKGPSPDTTILRYVRLRVLHHRLCRKSEICVGEISRGVCSGDSGGPLVVAADRGTRYFQVGIASHVNSVLGCGTLSVYARVGHYDPFVSEYARKTNTTVCFL